MPIPRVSGYSVNPYNYKPLAGKFSNAAEKIEAKARRILPAEVQVLDKAPAKNQKWKMDFDCGEVREYEYFIRA